MIELSALLTRAFAGPDSPGRGGDVPLYIAGSTFLVIPILMGLCSVWVRRKICPEDSSFNLGNVLNLLLFSIAGSAIVLREGVICLIMAAPLLFLVLCAGEQIGHKVCDIRNRTLQVSIVPFLLAAVLVDSASPHRFENSVVDTVVVHASPAQVWKYVGGYPAIETSRATLWLFRLGLPAPVQSKVEAMKVGAKRVCLFEQGHCGRGESLCSHARNRSLHVRCNQDARRSGDRQSLRSPSRPVPVQRQRRRHDDSHRHKLVQPQRLPDAIL